MCNFCDIIECESECNCMERSELDECLAYKLKNQRLQIKNDIVQENYNCLLDKYNKLKKECESNEKNNRDNDKACQEKNTEIKNLKNKIASLEEEKTILVKKITKLSKESTTTNANVVTKNETTKKIKKNGILYQLIKTNYHSNGKIKSVETITYKDGKEESEILNYDKNGNLIKK